MSSIIVADCPDCGKEVTLADVPQPLRLYVTLCALMVHAATIDTLMSMPEYLLAKPGWEERMETITTFADEHASEMAVFGEGFDES